MTEQATIIDFLGASLRGLEASGRAILSPNEQKLADEIADALDRELEDMVSQLESVASCQQEEDLEDDTPEEELPPFAPSAPACAVLAPRFCRTLCANL
mgnify:CR=1 FL=1